MSKTADFLIDLIYPNRCPFCDSFIPYDRLCCESCEKELEPGSFCPKCGQAVCECKSRRFNYDGCVAVYKYAGVAREGVLSLKYRVGFNTAKYAAPEIVNRLNSLGFLSADVITAVPMTKKRRKMTVYCYNQSEVIAKCVSKLCKIPCDFKLLSKKASAPTQHELTAAEREAAVRGTYLKGRSRLDLTGKTVILCDDILTTGSTLSECASVLKSLGAKKVYCAVICVTENKQAEQSPDS